MDSSVTSLHTITDRQKEAIAAALGDVGQAVVVQGWAGTGKSTVLDAMARDVLAVGGLVVSVPQGFDFAVCRSSSTDDQPTATISSVDGRTDRIAEHVLTHAAERPTLVTIDDINELDDDQCRHLRSLVRGIGPEVTIAVSIRSQLGCSGEAGRLVDDLQQVMRATVVNLGPWSAETVVAWAEAELDSKIGLQSAGTIVEWTAGLPGWTTFVARSLLDAELLRPVSGRLELVADLRRTAEQVGPAVRRYFDPVSEHRWTVAGLLLRTGPIPIGHLERLGQAVGADGAALSTAADLLLDEAILNVGRGHAISFTNPLIEAVVQLDVGPDPAADHRLAEVLVAEAGHRQDRHLARALCRVACSAPVAVDAEELLAAAEQIAPYDLALAREAAGTVLGRGGDAIDGARRLLAQLEAIGADERTPSLGSLDGSSLVAPHVPSSPSNSSAANSNGSGNSNGTRGDGADGHAIVAGSGPAIPGARPLAGRPAGCDSTADAIVIAYHHNRQSAAPLEGVRLDLGLVAHLLSIGRPGDAERLLDGLAVEPLAGILAVRLERLRRLHTVMTGGSVDHVPVDDSRLRDPVVFCTDALLDLRRPRSSRSDSMASAPKAPGRWRRMIDWLGSVRAGRPELLTAPRGGTPATGTASVDQFTSFVEQSFVDGAILVVDCLDGVPSSETRSTFQRMLLSSWAADLPPQRTGAAGLLLDPYDERIARLVADGHTNAEVAAQLDVAAHTVSNRLKVVYRRLGVRNRTELRRAMGPVETS